MKKLNIFLVTSACLLFSTSVYAITVTGHASAVIKKNIAATETQLMDFGIIGSDNSAGTVTMSPAGVKTSSLSTYGASKAGIFNVTGEGSTAITVSIANGTLTSGANTMALTNFTHTSSPASDTTASDGTMTLNVGADLAVAANQASGNYSGTYIVTLSY